MITAQAPIGSGFTAASTAAEVLDGVKLRGTAAVVTGGASGLGIETARALAVAGATVVVPARNVVAAGARLAGIDGVQIEYLDFLEPASIDAFAERFLTRYPSLQILINGAGVMGLPLTRDDRGYELHFATNHLGHFHLTARLWPALVRAEGARVVSVSSSGHRHSPVHFDDLHYQHRGYEPMTAYGQSKTGNILFALALDERGRGLGVRAFSLHPGNAYTPLARHFDTAQLQAIGVLDAAGRPVVDPADNKKSVEQGAATAVWCATSPLLDGAGGVYCEDCDIAPVASAEQAAVAGQAGPRLTTAGFAGVLPYAVDPDSAERLWAASARLAGVGLG
jgi:NAD(P)-dependent dehydrogenase (short-subunit alcohol dehydrogenase family)